MSSFCNADCGVCSFKDGCRGCVCTKGSPFGGTCPAAEYIKVGGLDGYRTFKESLRSEINRLLTACDIPETPALYELPGSFVNLRYPLPNGETVGFLDDRNIYLGCQIECGEGFCFGVVADTGFILCCRYGLNGSDPELIFYRKR